MPRKVEITHKTVFFTIGVLVLVWFLVMIRDVIFQIFVALLIMTILNPTVSRLQKLGVPRAASVLIVYIAVFGFLGFFVAQLIPLFADQTTRFIESISDFFESLVLPASISDQVSREITSQLSTLPAQALRIVVSVFSNLLEVFTVLIFALYFTLARDRLDKHLGVFFQDNGKEERIKRMVDRLESDLGGWARGQIVLMVLVGVLTYIGLLILGIPFALPLALLAGILEIVPNVGPIIAAFPAIIVAFGVSPVTALAVGALYFLIQQLESYVFTPKIMERSANVSPIVTLTALIVGLRVAGIVGALVSIPVAITARVVIDEFVNNKKSA